MDTGIDTGLSDTRCPPFLQYQNGQTTACSLIYTSDATSATYGIDHFSSQLQRGSDFSQHGTIVASIAAGYAGSASAGRDEHHYAYTQGVAPGARVAMCNVLIPCLGLTYRSFLNDILMPQTAHSQLRFALNTLNGNNHPFEPTSGPSPSISVFNHSWNVFESGYDDATQLLDLTAYRYGPTPLFDAGCFYTSSIPLEEADDTVLSHDLHVVASGNCFGCTPGDYGTVQSPGGAKNVITVGATQGYSFPPYTPRCSTADGLDAASDPLQLADFTRVGYPYQLSGLWAPNFWKRRIKPDLVAPGSRAYGRTSAVITPYCTACSSTLADSSVPSDNHYAMNSGTSFATPVVSGAAAVVREWLRTLGLATPPTLVKAALIAGAKNLCIPDPGLPSNPFAACGPVLRPAPDPYQGWGAVSLDRYFQQPSASHYFFAADQFTNAQTGAWAKTLWVTDSTKPVTVTLVWNDQPSLVGSDPAQCLIHDLDLSAVLNASPAFGSEHTYYGNLYWRFDSLAQSWNAATRDGFSIRDDQAPQYDRYNNVERIDIRPSELAAGERLDIGVTRFSYFDPGFSIAVLNAHE